ncbi:MAG: hypothetical protein GH151_11290 [Bacteroidetes bacterium]|nr:hypothetical protein [Bacteroidota bacterium]
MLKHLRKKTIIILLTVFIVVSGIFGLPIIYSLSDHLSATTRVDANILIVEGWLPPYAIEMAYHEFMNKGYNQIITTGIGLISHEYYMVAMNGYLIFYPQRENLSDNNISVHKIEVDAFSELGGENASRFNIFIDDSLVGNFQAEKKKRKYSVSWKGNLTTIDSIMVQFINDGIGEYGDRNLYIKGITIDQKIKIPYQKNSEYDIGTLDGTRRITNNFASYAELARNRLISLGIDSSIIKAIESKRVKINKTLTSALAFRDWLKTTDLKVKGINIVSMGTHARRTWMTYNKILDKKYDIGVISLPDYNAHTPRSYKVLKTIRETIRIVYYWFILIPY